MLNYFKRKFIECLFPHVYSTSPIREMSGDFLLLIDGKSIALPNENLKRFGFPRNAEGNLFYHMNNDACDLTFVVLRYGTFTGIILREIEEKTLQATSVYTGEIYRNVSLPHQDVKEYAAQVLVDIHGWARGEIY